jgi:hypothetical protein
VKYICEVCGLEEELTEQEAYHGGWDYPPFIGVWGVVSPRTCPNCPLDKTAYWAILTGDGSRLSEKHMATINRIIEEVTPEEHERMRQGASTHDR